MPRRVVFVVAVLVGLASVSTAGAVSTSRTRLTQPPVFQVGAAVVGLNPKVTVYSGGFGTSPPIKPGNVIGPRLSARAMYVSNGEHAIALALIDAQAEFGAYQEGPQYGISAARAAAAREINAAKDGPSIAASDIIIQATHSHSAPTLEGLWGPVPIAYLKAVTRAETKAIVLAASRARPARLRFGTADGSALDLVSAAQYDAFPGWADDPLLTVLQAVDPDSGATIATYATVPAHGDIVNGASLRHLTTDYFGLVHAALQKQLGGISIVAPGTLGREETPVQVGGLDADRVFAANVLNLVDTALAHANPVTSDRIAATERMQQIPGTGALLLALVAANHLPPKQHQQVQHVLDKYPIDRADSPPWQTVLDVGTPVTALRLGDIAYLSMPGEPFPEVRHALERAAPGATVVALSKGQDDLGYFYPGWVTPFTEIYPSDTFTNSASAVTGDAVIAGQESNLDRVGFATRHVAFAPVSTKPLQALDAGLQVIGGPFVADAGRDGKAAVRMIPTYAPPDLPSGTTEDGLPVGGFEVQGNPTSKVHWSFGETSGYHNFTGDDREPQIVTHSFGVGVHHVTAWILDAGGAPVETALTIRVYPRLRVHLLGDRVVVRGGDGHVLAARWSRDGRTVTVTDGTGAMATAHRR